MWVYFFSFLHSSEGHTDGQSDLRGGVPPAVSVVMVVLSPHILPVHRVITVLSRLLDTCLLYRSV